MTRVFVYGTLKRGGSNHHFLAGQRYLGNARTTGSYTLYAVADYPGMVRSADPAHFVTGEVWAVDATCLAQLDQLEGLAEGLYTREPIPLAAPFADQPVDTYLYLRRIAGHPMIGSTWA